MRVGGRGRGRWRRGVGRRTAVVMAVVLALSVAAPPQGLFGAGVDPLPLSLSLSLSWLWSWWGLPAGWASPPLPPTPQQDSAGGAGDRSHSASSDSTRAHRGVGQSPGKGAGQLDAYAPHQVSTSAVTTPPAAGDQSFDPGRSRRIAADSTATSDIFHNPDGSYTRRVYAGPHNFRAGDGSWTPIDTTVAKGSDGRWRENANAFGVDFAGSADDGSLVSVSLDGSHAVAYGLADAAGVAPTVAGSTVSYPGVLAGTDLSLTTTATGVKESLVLRSAAVATSWVFPLRLQGLSGRLESDGSVSFVDGAGVVRATVPPGSMSDSKVDPGTGQPATSQGVSYQLITVAGGPALRMSVDATWLTDPARVFPVTVDPTVNTTASASTFADSTVPGDNSGSALVNVGTRNGTEKAYSFLQFPSFGTTYGVGRASPGCGCSCAMCGPRRVRRRRLA